jgi:hypothetical protein
MWRVPLRWRFAAAMVFTLLPAACTDTVVPPGLAAGGNGGHAGASLGGAPASGGAAGAVPSAWTCPASAYGDGACDCGCGTADVDCTQPDLAHCQVCNTFGSCNLADCPGRIDPADVTTCLAPPAGWTCTPSTYGDGKVCECGCGVPDIDCPDSSAASCDNCLAQGSCAQGLCPSSIAPGDNAHCAIPGRWSCAPSSYGDGICDCGCGAVDVDCPDARASSCQSCDVTSCSPLDCGGVKADDNAHCPTPPYTWRCSPRLYGDGARCDCGCGAVDPDCLSQGLEACDRCDDPGSCSAAACPGLIDPTAIAFCAPQPTPPGWTCGPGTYGDGTCDCGCSIPDVDCRSADPAACVRCLECGGHGSCQGSIETADPTQCAPPPTGWTCSTQAYRDIRCDCGCGLPDPSCQGISLLYVCENFPVEGCSGGKSFHVDPSHNALCVVSIPGGWTCDRSYYDDGLCDCGCGVPDLDCPSADVTACDVCNDAGSCSPTACPGTIARNDSAQCEN